jgi:hypothetical protein
VLEVIYEIQEWLTKSLTGNNKEMNYGIAWCNNAKHGSEGH